jgi:hypothetical protein
MTTLRPPPVSWAMKRGGWIVAVVLGGCGGGWAASRSDHVTVYTEARLEHEFIQEWLELSHDAYRAFFPGVDPGRVDAVWLKNEPGSGSRFFGLFDDPRAGWTLEGLPRSTRIGRGGLIVLERLDDAHATRDEGVARRQMAHLFVMRAVPAAPLWLQVGLSRYLAKFRIHRQGDKWLACFGGAAFDEPPEINLVPGARSGHRVSAPLQELLATDWYDYDRRLRYWYEYTAYALVHYLIHGAPGHAARFRVLLQALNRGAGTEEALALAYPDVLDDEWDEKLTAHVRPPMGAAFLAATPEVIQGLCYPVPAAAHAADRPRRLATDATEIQTLLDDLEQVDIFRRHAAWLPRDIVDAEAARHPRRHRPGTGHRPPGGEAPLELHERR